MKTITLLNKENVIIKEFDSATCISKNGFNSYNLDSNLWEEINFGQKVFNVKVLESTSVIFTIEEDSEVYNVVTTINFFGTVSDADIEEVKRLKKIYRDAQKQLNDIIENIIPLS